MTMPSDGAVFADEADLPVCAEQPVVDKPTAAKSDKSIFSYLVLFILFLLFLFFFLFVLLGRNNYRKNLS
mgnify:FL=1